jgi:predicted nucleic acid-binding protein
VAAYLRGVPFTVVLDACVLYPLPLRDTLLRAAQQNLYAVRWSQRILDEVARNLVEDRRATPEQARNLIDAMERAFEDAEVPEAAIASLEPAMTNEPADRHVLAAAVASDADAIVTSNLRHFPASACGPFGIQVAHPDAFLCELHERVPAKIRVALAEQAAALSRPPFTVTELLDLLAATVPEFVSQVRASE